MSLSAQDRIGLRGVFDRYAWGYDCSDAPAYADAFHPEGVLITSSDVRHEGRPAIMKFAQRHFDAANVSALQHRMSNHHFDGDSKVCTAYCYWAQCERAKLGEPGYVKFNGHYAAICEKQAGIWYFRELLIRHGAATSLPWTRRA
jgi:hypothetical protein